MDDIQPNTQNPRLPGMGWRVFCSCALLAGVLLLPLSSVYAAPTLSAGAKKAVKSTTTLTQTSKKSVGKKDVARGSRADRKAVHKVEQKKTKAALASHKAEKGRKKVEAKRERVIERATLAKTGQTAGPANNAARNEIIIGVSREDITASSVRDESTVQTRISASPKEHRTERVSAKSGTGPFQKRRAILDENTRLANTLQNRLGVEVQEDGTHSGGLFIAPPASGLDRADKAMDLLANLPLGKPLADNETLSVSSRFGGRQDPINGRKAFHEGIDFRAKRGTKVRATGKGEVVHSGYSPAYGENVIISHGKGYETMFAHLSKRLVRVGDTIKPGDIVGLVGSTGRSTGSHLHYEIRLQGAPINPTDYVRATQQARLQKKYRTPATNRQTRGLSSTG